MRIKARRQKELEEGSTPEVLLDSFPNPVKHDQHTLSEPPKRVLTLAAKAAQAPSRKGQEAARDSVLVDCISTATNALLSMWCQM